MADERGAIDLSNMLREQAAVPGIAEQEDPRLRERLGEQRTAVVDGIDKKAFGIDDFATRTSGYVTEKVGISGVDTVVNVARSSSEWDGYTTTRQEYISDALQRTADYSDGATSTEDPTTKAINLAVKEHNQLRRELLRDSKENKKDTVVKRLGRRSTAAVVGTGAGFVGGVAMVGPTVFEIAAAGTAAWFATKAATVDKMTRHEYTDSEYINSAAKSTGHYMREKLQLSDFATEDRGGHADSHDISFDDEYGADDDIELLERLSGTVDTELKRLKKMTSRVKEMKKLRPSEVFDLESRAMRVQTLEGAQQMLTTIEEDQDAATAQLNQVRAHLATNLLDVELLYAQKDDIKETRKKRIPRVVAAIAGVAVTMMWSHSAEAEVPSQEDCNTHYTDTYNVDTGEGEVLPGCNVDQEDRGENGENAPDTEVPTDLPAPDVTDEDPSSDLNENLQ